MTMRAVRRRRQRGQVLPPGKVKTAYLQGDYKDASDALAADDTEAIRRAIWDARVYRPDGIVEGRNLLELVNYTKSTIST